MSPPEETVSFQQLVETLLDKTVASGLEPPITFVLVSVNGHVCAVRYSRNPNGEWDRILLVEGREPKGKFHVNLCFFDASGKSLFARVDDPNAVLTMIQ